MENSLNEKLNQKRAEEIATILSSINPKETLNKINNKMRHSNYFSNRRNLSIETFTSILTVKDNITECQNTFKSNFQKGHKKSLSKTIYFINNKQLSKVEIIYDRTSTKITSYKVPSKELNESVDDPESDEEENDNINDNFLEFTEDKIIENLTLHPEIIFEDEFECKSPNFEYIFKIIQIYENLIKNLDNFALFLLKYKDNFEIIEKWFDLTDNLNLYKLNKDNLKLYNDSFNLENNYNISEIHEVIIFGFIINLYELIRNNNVISNVCYFNLYNNLKSCIMNSFNNILIILNLLIKKTNSKEENQYEISCREILENNKVWLNSMMCNEIENNNKIVNNLIIKSIDKFNNIDNELKQQKRIENGIDMKNYINADLKNLEYIFFSLQNYEKTNYEGLREVIYNEYLLGNLVKNNFLDKNDESEDEEDFDDNESDDEDKNIQTGSSKNEVKEELQIPFLPPIDSKKYKCTLVLDLDETLVHYMEDGDEAYVQVRPYAEYFLIELSNYFEIVIFTAATEEYADIVLNELDKHNSIKHVLYRKHTCQKNNIYIKDLSKIGRDLTKTVIVDNVKDNFSLQPLNGLHIKSFFGDENDFELRELISDLKSKIIYFNK